MVCCLLDFVEESPLVAFPTCLLADFTATGLPPFPAPPPPPAAAAAAATGRLSELLELPSTSSFGEGEVRAFAAAFVAAFVAALVAALAIELVSES